MAEISEPTTAVALFFGKGELKSVFNSIQNGTGGDMVYLKKWWASTKWQSCLKDNSKIVGLSEKDLNKLNQKKAFAEIGKAISDKQKKEKTAAYYNAMSDVAVGVSAALAIYKWLDEFHGSTAFGGNSKITKVFVTGTKWDSEIDKFKVPYAGMNDYNSSDIVIRTKKNCYFGVSVKKKYTHKKTDPTMINRSITKVLEEVNNSREKAEPYKIEHQTKKGKTIKVVNPAGTQAKAADKLLNLLAKKRHDVYDTIVKSDVFRNMVFEQEGVYVPKLDKISGIELYKYFWVNKTKRGQLTTVSNHTDKILGITKTIRTKKIYSLDEDSQVDQMPSESPSKALINFKGKGEKIRKYVNAQLASSSNNYFTEIKKILEGKTVAAREVVQELANELTDHILKLSLPEKLNSNTALSQYHFGFCLCTGIAELTKPSAISPSKQKDFPKGKITIDYGKAIDTSSILCVLSKYFGAGTQKEDYYFQLRSGTGKAADIGVDMYKNIAIGKTAKVSRHILWMQLRYKGNFLMAPDFQARISDDFSTLLKGACDPDEHH